MPKVFPYLSERTARQVRMAAATRSVKHRALFEAAIEAYSAALTLTNDPNPCDPEDSRRVSVALNTALGLVRNRPKKGLKKVGTTISDRHNEILLSILSGRSVSDTLELALTYYLWREPHYQEEKDNLTHFLWPMVDLPSGFNLGRFMALHR